MPQGLMGFQPQTTQAPRAVETPTAATQVAGQQLNTLSNRLKGFSDAMMQRHAEVVSKKASEEGYRDVVDNKTYTPQEAYTVYGKAYNNAASGTYSAQSELLLDSQAQKLAMQFDNDPNGYASSMEEFTKGLANDAPTEALRASIGIHGTRLRDRGFGKLTVSANKAHVATQKKSMLSAYKLAVEQSKESAITNPRDSLDYATKGQRILQTMVESGFIDANTAELQTMETEKEITKELVLNGYLQSEDKVSYMEELYTNDKMSATEKKEAIDYIKGDISNKNMIEKGLEEKEEVDLEVDNKAMSLELNTQLVDGTLTKETLDNAMRADAIDLETYTKYQKRINTAGVGASDPEELHSVRVNLGSQTEQTIYDNELLSNEDQKTLVSELRNKQNWQNTRLARQAGDELKGFFGISKDTIVDKLDFDNQLVKDMNMLDSAVFDEVESLPLELRAQKALEVTRRWIGEYDRGEIPNTQPYTTKIEEEKMATELEQAKKEDAKEDTTNNAFNYFLDMLPGR